MHNPQFTIFFKFPHQHVCMCDRRERQRERGCIGEITQDSHRKFESTIDSTGVFTIEGSHVPLSPYCICLFLYVNIYWQLMIKLMSKIHLMILTYVGMIIF